MATPREKYIRAWIIIVLVNFFAVIFMTCNKLYLTDPRKYVLALVLTFSAFLIQLFAVLWETRLPNYYSWYEVHLFDFAHAFLFLTTIIGVLTMAISQISLTGLEVLIAAELLCFLVLDYKTRLIKIRRRDEADKIRQMENFMVDYYVSLAQLEDLAENDEIRQQVAELTQFAMHYEAGSTEHTAEIDCTLFVKRGELEKAIQNSDLNQVQSLVKEIAGLIESRDERCKYNPNAGWFDIEVDEK